MEEDTLKKLSDILDTLIGQNSPETKKDSNSINALLTSVLVQYKDKKLDRNHKLGFNNEINETTIVKKIFLALKTMFARNPSVLIDDERHILILASAFPFFNCLHCSIELIDDVLFTLIQIVSECFRKGLLMYNSLISQQREYVLKNLDNLLSDLIKSFTNTDTPDILGDSQDLDSKLVSITEFSSMTLSKISKISTTIKIVQFLIHPSIFKLYFTQYSSSFILDSYISKCWFCLENIIVNIKFTPENNQIIAMLDNLYSTLLLTTVDYYYNDSSSQTNRLQLALKSCHFLLNWALLTKFNSLQIVLAQCLLKLDLNLKSLNNSKYLYEYLDSSKTPNDLMHPELIKSLNTVFGESSDILFDSTELQALNERRLLALSDYYNSINIQSNRVIEKPKLESFMYDLTQEIVDDYDKNVTDISDKYFTMPSLDLIKTINRLGLYTCYLSGNYSLLSRTCKLCDSNHSISSYITQNVDIKRPKLLPSTKIYDVYLLLALIASKKAVSGNTDIIIALLIAFTRLFRSYRAPIIENQTWDFIQYCFTNKIREIRLLSVKLFPLIIYTPEDEQYHKNIELIISYLFRFSPSHKSEFYIFEGYIIALGELLTVKTIDSNYYIILNQLVKFMSETDEFRSNMAIHELRIVARTKNITAWQVIEPFLPILSRDIIKNRFSTTGLLENFCAAIDMEKETFIVRTLAYTVPFAVGSLEKDHVTFISNLAGKSKLELLTTYKDEILAFLLVSSKDLDAARIIRPFQINDPSYKDKTIVDLIDRLSHLLVHIFYHYNSEEKTLERIREVLNIISTAAYNTTIEKMLNACMFGIVQNIAIAINEKSNTPFAIKIRAIKSVVCLLKLCNSFEACLSQIITALQVAVNSSELRKEALLCIDMIINTVNVSSLEFVYDTLISQFLLQFSTYSEKHQILASNIIRSLCSKLPGNQSYRYSLKSLPDMKNVIFQHLRIRKFVTELRLRFRSDNIWVIEQVLDDLTLFLTSPDSNIYQTIKEDENIGNSLFSITESIMNNSSKINIQGLNSQIPFKSARVLGLLGNIDLKNSGSSKKYIQSPYDNITHFLFPPNVFATNQSEHEYARLEFCKYFLNNILVRSYISSVNPNEQKVLAYTIQEFLTVCKFPPIVYDHFDELNKSILEPLKERRYGQKHQIELPSYPIYKKTKDYSAWLKELTTKLLVINTGLAHHMNIINEQVASVCMSITQLDTFVLKFILPYAVLFLAAYESNNKNHKTDLVNEFLLVLNTNLNSLDNDVIKESVKKCIITIIEILQFIKATINKLKEEEDSIKSSNRSLSKSTKSAIQRLEIFVSRFPMNVLAERCAECDMFEGSILFLEQSYKEDSIQKDEFFTTLKDMYVELEDYDQLHGVLKTFSTNSLNDKLLQFKYNEDPQVSNESLNAIAELNFPGEMKRITVSSNYFSEYHKSTATELFNVLNKNCEYEQLLLNLKNYTIDSAKSINPDWVLSGLQASIFTGDMENLRKYLNLSQQFNVISMPGSDFSIYYEIASALMDQADHESCIQHIDNAVKYIGLAISNTENIVHRKIPDYMVLLHGLEDCKLIQKSDPNGSANNETMKYVKRRLQNSKQDFKSLWKIHSMKSSMLRIRNYKDEYQTSLVEGCQILRENGRLPQATKLITQALVLNDRGSEKMTQTSTLLINVEFAKLFWAQNDYETALKTMNLVLQNINDKNPNYVESHRVYLNWLDVSAEGSSDEIKQKYKLLTDGLNLKNAHKVYYQYAVYLNKLLEAQSIDEADGSLDFSVISNYIKSVYGCDDFVHQTLPKMVTLWLDYYQKYMVPESTALISRKIIDSRNNAYMKIKDIISKYYTHLGGQWYVVLTQLISRITHDDKEIIELISKIIIQLTEKFPSILLYSVFAQSRSVDNNRRKIGSKIMSSLQDTRTSSKKGDLPLPKIVASGLLLLESIMSVCNATHNYKHPKSGTLMKDLYKDLNFNYPRDSPSRSLALPIKENMDLLYNLKGDADKKFIYYERFHEKVKILFSLQQPRRVKVTGSNGLIYFLLFKPHDDLRKDNKVMEFSTIMNELLVKNYETQTRNMQIKSFAATPLNETTGIIEWVQDFITLRPIIDKQLKRENIVLNMRSMKAEFGEARDADKLNIYESYLTKYPPVLGEWMVENCPNITQWYNFRSLYTRSLAVMSIIGYLIGVGDRHLDNIMLNRNTGMIMHIDFDCMFEKGKKLSVPEIVPFRLTPNLEEAMGILGYEGSFRKSCELTMSLIRNNENILMNFLESFIYDPLMDWRSSSSEKSSEEKNKQRIKKNQERVYKILRNKIRGILTKEDDNTGYRDSGGLSVGVSFQVDLLIQTAVSHENLSKMFFGWMPFL